MIFLELFVSILLLSFCEFYFSIDEVFMKIASVSEFCNFRKRVGNRKQNEQKKRRGFCYFSLMKSILCIRNPGLLGTPE